jgi:serine protease Do
MNKRLHNWAVALTVAVTCWPLAGWCQDIRALPDSPAALAQREEQNDRPDESRPDESRRGGSGRWRSWFSSARGKNHDQVKTVFQTVARDASSATVQILADGQPAALGTVVDQQGVVVSKASLLSGKLVCRLGDERELEARLVGSDDEHDLAVLKVDATDLSAAVWRDTPAPPGTLVAALGADDLPLGIGVISTEPRRIARFGPANPDRGWLGVSLGTDQAGVIIMQVVSGTAAEQAGLQLGDVIVNVAGKKMESIEQVIQAVGSCRPAQTLTLLIRRDDQEREVTATLGKPPAVEIPEDSWGGGPFSVRRGGFPAALAHDVAIRPEQCGGPLVDTDGRVVGINIARALRVTTLALDADTVQRLVRQWQTSLESQ